MLRKFQAESAFLSRLQCDPARLPIVRVQMRDYIGYSLNADTINAWRAIEASLLQVATILYEAMDGHPEHTMPFNVFWSLPSEHKYDAVYRDLRDVRASALKARDALQVLTARVSMGIALVPTKRSWEPGWIEVLRRAGVLSAWIDELRDSPLCDFTPGTRAGAFVVPHPSGTRWMNHVPCMIRANLPVYVKWPQTSDSRLDERAIAVVVTKYPFLEPYRPNLLDAVDVPEPVAIGNRPPSRMFRWDHLRPRTAMQHSFTPPLQSQRHSRPTPFSDSSPAPHPHPDSPQLQVLPAGDGQLAGETIEMFLARRSVEDQRRIETDAQRTAREARASSAKRKEPPGRKSNAKFFLWMTYADLDPTLPVELHDLPLRQSISKGTAISRWAEFSDEQKTFNPYRNEWDLCENLGPPVADEDYERLPPIPLPTTAPNSTITSSFHQHLALFYDSEEDIVYRPHLEAFDDVAWFRYGLIPEVVPGSSIQYHKHNHITIMRYFARLDDELVDGDHVKAASGYIEALRSSRTPTAATIPGVICDMSTASDRWLGSADHAHPSLSLEAVVFNGEQWYALHYAGSDTPWHLLTDARNALELFRRHSVTTVVAAARYLAERGMAFRTVQDEDPSRKFQGLTPPSPALGRRPREFKKFADKKDYRAYEARARALLNEPRGRAALLQGGIVWRIAMELLGEDALERAISGPSSDCHLYGREFVPPSKQAPYYDDQLTEDEISLIIGAYVLPQRTWYVSFIVIVADIRVGEENLHQQKSMIVSWWPSPEQWQKYKGYQAYWGPDHEKWFQTRLDGVRCSDMRPRSGTHWKDSTKYKHAPAFHSLHNTLCENIIATMYQREIAQDEVEDGQL